MCIGKSSDYGLYFTNSGACECEYDCEKICVGCDKYFCELKNEFDCKHDEEMPEAVTTNAGEHFCHRDCLDSYYG